MYRSSRHQSTAAGDIRKSLLMAANLLRLYQFSSIANIFSSNCNFDQNGVCNMSRLDGRFRRLSRMASKDFDVSRRLLSFFLDSPAAIPQCFGFRASCDSTVSSINPDQ